MELERDVKIVVLAHLDDETVIESVTKKPNEYKIRLNDRLKSIPELCSTDDTDQTTYINGYRMKCRLTKSSHIADFTKELDRTIEIVEPGRRSPYVDIQKHYPISSFDLSIIAARTKYQSLSPDDWWTIYKTLIVSIDTVRDAHEKQIDLFCAPAFTLPLPRQLARQADSLIQFYEMFKASLFTVYQRSASTSFLSNITHILPVIQLSFRPEILRSFDERIRKHPRLKRLLSENSLCLIATGSKETSFKYDFTLIEQQIMRRFNSSECYLQTLVKRFALKYLRCSLDNPFLRTSIFWICEIHELKNYHHIFEVWISFMRDVCRKKYLSHYFLDDVNVYEEYEGFSELVESIDYRNIDEFIRTMGESLIFPYVYQYNDRMKILTDFLQSYPVLALKMKTVYKVNVLSQFPNADCSLYEMASVICHLSFLEDNNPEHFNSFWNQQWKPFFVDADRDDIVLQDLKTDFRPDQVAQQMTASVYKLIQMDLEQAIEITQRSLYWLK